MVLKAICRISNLHCNVDSNIFSFRNDEFRPDLLCYLTQFKAEPEMKKVVVCTGFMVPPSAWSRKVYFTKYTRVLRDMVNFVLPGSYKESGGKSTLA